MGHHCLDFCIMLQCTFREIVSCLETKLADNILGSLDIQTFNTPLADEYISWRD